MNSITKQTYVTLPFSKINRFYVKHNQNFKLPAQSKQQPDIVGKKSVFAPRESNSQLEVTQ